MIEITRAPRPATVAVHKRGGRYVVDVSVTEAGTRRRYRQKFDAKAAASAHADAIRERLRAGLSAFAAPGEGRTPLTVLEVLEAYEPKTGRGAQHITAFRKTRLAGKSAEAFELADLEGYVAERKGLKTCAKDFSFLKRACAYAKAKGLIERHYFERLAGDKVTRRRLMPAYKIAESPGREIPDADFETIFAKLAKDARRAVLFARTTGCRLNEVASLDWFDHFNGEGFFRPITQKGSKPRLVAYDPEVVGLAIRGPRRLGSVTLVFAELGFTAKEIRGRLQAKWRYAVKKAKTPHYRFHDLRHTYGTLLRRAGTTYSDIAAIMGITEAMAHVYAHEDTERIQREAAKLGTNSALSRLAKLA